MLAHAVRQIWSGGRLMHQKVRDCLEQGGVAYTLHRHADFEQVIGNPMDFAAALGYPPERITKAVFLESRKGDKHAIALCSVTEKLDLSAIAAALEAKRMTMAKPERLAELIGYPSMGVSPIGVDPVPVFMDEALCALPTVLIGAGAVGVEVEIEPNTLARLINARVMRLTV